MNPSLYILTHVSVLIRSHSIKTRSMKSGSGALMRSGKIWAKGSSVIILNMSLRLI